MSSALVNQSWARRGLAIVLVLVVLSPVFAWGAQQVGYTEPLENAAEASGGAEQASPIFEGLIPGYTLAGLNPYVGTLLSAVLGTALVLVTALGLGRLLSDSDEN